MAKVVPMAQSCSLMLNKGNRIRFFTDINSSMKNLSYLRNLSIKTNVLHGYKRSFTLRKNASFKNCSQRGYLRNQNLSFYSITAETIYF